MRSTAIVLFFWSCVALSAGETRFSGVAAIDAVEVWLSARDSVAGSVLSCGTANLDQVACVSSSLLRLCGGSVASFIGAAGPSGFASHIHLDVVRHWFGAVKKFPALRRLLHVVSPGAPVGIARGGDFHAELAYGNRPSVASQEVAIHKKVCSDVVHGRALVFDLLSAVDIVGLRVSSLAIILEPKLRIVHDLPFASAAAGRALTAIPIFLPRRRASSATFCTRCCCVCCFCGRRTAVAFR